MIEGALSKKVAYIYMRVGRCGTWIEEVAGVKVLAVGEHWWAPSEAGIYFGFIIRLWKTCKYGRVWSLGAAYGLSSGQKQPWGKVRRGWIGQRVQCRQWWQRASKRGLTTFWVGGNVNAYESGDELFERNRPKKESLLAKSQRWPSIYAKMMRMHTIIMHCVSSYFS